MIPAIRETRAMIRLPSERLLHLDQEGWLRPFDAATMLWPAGYLLALYMGDPARRHPWCGRPGDTAPVVLELGAGVGAAALAAASCGSRVLATDVARRSLALVAANAAANGLWTTEADEEKEVKGEKKGGKRLVEVQQIDWNSDGDISRLETKAPFAAVVGAALQFEKWPPGRLWGVLRRLVDASAASLASSGPTLQSPPPPVVLVHTAESTALDPPPGSGFAVNERISGAEYGMVRAGSASESEFVVVVLRRSTTDEARGGGSARAASTEEL